MYCALVNGGNAWVPGSQALTDANGSIVKEFVPEPLKTIFSELTADRVKEMMKTVVTEGTGTAGYVEGYRVAGKTSTSTIDVGDDKGMHVLSFGCYAPYDNPEIVVLVVINKPFDKELGSSAATRVAARIVSSTLEYMDVDRILTESDYHKLVIKYEVPDVVGMSFKAAKQTLFKEGFTVIPGEDNMTNDQEIGFVYPSSDQILYRGGSVVLYSAEPEPSKMRQVMVPDFTGKNITECIRLAQDSGVNINIRGNAKGVVVLQNPEYGYILPESGAETKPGETENGEPGTSITDPSATDETEMSEDNSTYEIEPPVKPERITIPAGTIIELTME